MTKVKVSWTVEEKKASIKLIASDGKESVTIGPFSKMEDLEREVEALCKEFHFALEKAKGEWLSREREQRSKQAQDPQTLWAVLKSESKDNMIKLFNAQEENVRKLVAKYVFENVNVFSGPGAVFAELYNQETGLLEP